MDGSSFGISQLREMLGPQFNEISLDDMDFRTALDAALDPQNPIVAIMGPGGCGKSVIYRAVAHVYGDSALCLAYTGVAAFNLSAAGCPAVTIHRGLRIQSQEMYDQSQVFPMTLKILKRANVVLIDEVSMVPSDMMDLLIRHIDISNRNRRGRQVPLRLVLFGDVMQLPPVETREKQNARAQLGYPETMFFNSHLYRAHERKTFDLTRSYRQENPEFCAMLGGFRMNRVTDGMLEAVNRHVMPSSLFVKQKGSFLYLAARNESVDSVNAFYQGMFERKGAPGFAYEAVYSKSEVQDFPSVRQMVRIHEGMQVMCVANSPCGDYQNGTLGIVDGFSGGMPHVVTDDGRSFGVGMHEWEKYSLSVSKDGGIVMKKTGSVRQVGCRPAYAVTFHKAQGLTLDRAYMDFSGWVPEHVVYLGLSRLRSLDGLGLKVPVTRDMIKVSQEAMGFFDDDRDLVRAEQPVLF